MDGKQIVIAISPNPIPHNKLIMRNRLGLPISSFSDGEFVGTQAQS